MCKLADVIRYTVLSQNFNFCCFRAMAYIRLWNWVQFWLRNYVISYCNEQFKNIFIWHSSFSCTLCRYIYGH